MSMQIYLTTAEEDALLSLLAPICNEAPTDAQQTLYDKVYSRHDSTNCPHCGD